MYFADPTYIPLSVVEALDTADHLCTLVRRLSDDGSPHEDILTLVVGRLTTVDVM
jgi:hypothetical protein